MVSGFEGVSLDFLIDDLDRITPRRENSGIVNNENEVFSTMVELEIQFMADTVEEGSLEISIFRSFLSTYIAKENWVDNTLWIDEDCVIDWKEPPFVKCHVKGNYAIVVLLKLSICRGLLLLIWFN